MTVSLFFYQQFFISEINEESTERCREENGYYNYRQDRVSAACLGSFAAYTMPDAMTAIRLENPTFPLNRSSAEYSRNVVMKNNIVFFAIETVIL